MNINDGVYGMAVCELHSALKVTIVDSSVKIGHFKLVLRGLNQSKSSTHYQIHYQILNAKFLKNTKGTFLICS